MESVDEKSYRTVLVLPDLQVQNSINHYRNQGEFIEDAVRKRPTAAQHQTMSARREIDNRRLSRRAAAEGVVLLKNEGVLPVTADQPIAVFGNGIANIIKGGTGSGDVNSRDVVSVLDGLRNAGYPIVNEADTQKYMEEYDKAGREGGAEVLRRIEALPAGSDMAFFGVIAWK